MSYAIINQFACFMYGKECVFLCYEIKSKLHYYRRIC